MVTRMTNNKRPPGVPAADQLQTTTNGIETMTTEQIKTAIVQAIEETGRTATAGRVGRVYHCYMVTGCGHDVDLADAMAAVFGDDADESPAYRAAELAWFVNGGRRPY